jgi:septal ring factor EnvC (AmiA/AmiB activator)
MKNLDAWLDALQSKQEKLDRELQETEKRAAALSGNIGFDAAQLGATKKQIKSNPNLNKHFQELEKAADADGRSRAAAAGHELDALRGDKKSPVSGGRGRPGAVRI